MVELGNVTRDHVLNQNHRRSEAGCGSVYDLAVIL